MTQTAVKEDILITPEMEINWAWLELPRLPSKVENPFSYRSLEQNRDNPAFELIKIASDPEWFYFSCKYLLGFEPFPYQLVALEALWNHRFPIFIATRGGAKSSLLAIYLLLRMIFEPGIKAVIIGAGLRQARNVFDYMADSWKRSPILRDIAGGKKSRNSVQGPRREIDRYTFRVGDSVCHALPLGQGDLIRGLRANIIVADEFSSINEQIFNQVVMPMAAVSKNPVEKVKEFYKVKKLKEMGMWNDELESMFQFSSSRNQIIRSGTPTVHFNHFYKTFHQAREIIRSKGNKEYLRSKFGEDFEMKEGVSYKDYCIIRIPYNHLISGIQDEAVVAESRAKLTKNQFLMEYGAVFISDTDGFFKRSIIEAATTNKPILLPNGERVYFSAMKEGDKDKKYIISIDPAAERDNCALVVLEVYPDHRRVVYTWSISKKKLKAIEKYKGIAEGSRYYKYIARKVRDLMKVFPTVRICIDKNGGGIAIAEELRSSDNTEGNELPIFELVSENPDKPNEHDHEEGLHILELVKPNNDSNAEMSHALLKDMEQRALLFPTFDSVELARAAEIDISENEDYEYYAEMDALAGVAFDTYESVVNEIEDLKRELENIVVTRTPSGLEKFDVPSIKLPGQEKGALKKDRFSALLYANWAGRNIFIEDARNQSVRYEPVGKIAGKDSGRRKKDEPLYYGLGATRIKSPNMNRIYRSRS